MEEKTSEKNKKQTKVEVTAKFSPVVWPLLGDVFVIGKDNPLGKNAAMNIAELSEPNSYQLKAIENDPRVEAILINKSTLTFLDEGDITKYVLEQIAPFSIGKHCLRVDLSSVLVAKAEIPLQR